MLMQFKSFKAPEAPILDLYRYICYIYEVFTLCDSSFQAQACSFELKRLK